MKLRKVILSFIVLCLILFNMVALGPESSYAADSKVKVTIPTFVVEVNGMKINNKHALHPPVIYKGVMYLPLASDYAKALGLSVQANKKTGLLIQSGGMRSPLKEDQTGNNSLSQIYYAQIASTPIKINEEKINNKAQKYPILQFRDMTYIPMSWHFTHDLFQWDTEWNSKTGYHIRSAQIPVLFTILYDDANFLYVSTGTQGIYKINKALDGKYTPINEKETQSIMAKYAAQSEKYTLPQPEKSSELIVRKGDSLYYKEQELVSLVPYLKKVEEHKKEAPDAEPGIDFTGNFIKLDDGNSLLMLSVFYNTDIPGPYTPHDERVFVIHQDQVIQVTGYTQSPSALIKNPDGSYWIYSYAPPTHDMNAYEFDLLGQLALIDKSGKSYNINQKLKARDIDVLYADNQPLLIKAYNDRLSNNKAAKTDGFYKIDTRLSLSKIADSVHGSSYVGQNNQIFVLDPDKNTLTNVTTKKAHRWWDYELRSDLIH